MHLIAAIEIFSGSILLLSISSIALTGTLERLGTRFGLSGGTLGLLTALGADSPEISSAIFALSLGHNDMGVGVVLGSNIFNLATLLGLSAVLVGKIGVSRSVFLVNSGFSLTVLLVSRCRETTV
jgi:cation:H+ antiporter